MTSKTIYPPIIGDAENTTPVKKTLGVDANYNSTDLTPAQAGIGLFYWKDTQDVVYSNGVDFIVLG